MIEATFTGRHGGLVNNVSFYALLAVGLVAGLDHQIWRAAVSGAVPAGSAGIAVRAGWRAMRIATRLMPPAAGRRWLSEAGSFLAEAPPALGRRAVGNYLAAALKVIITSWATALARRTRQARRGPPPR